MLTINTNMTLPKLCLTNGELIELEHEVITNIVFRALKAAETPNRLLALNLADKIMDRVLLCKKAVQVMSIDEVHDIAEFVLIENGQFLAAREYKITRDQVNELFH